MAHRVDILVKRSYLHIAIVTLITAFVWTGISILRALSNTPTATVDPAVTAPFSPSLDVNALEDIVTREDLSGLPFEPPTKAPEINEVTTEEVGGSTTDPNL